MAQPLFVRMDDESFNRLSSFVTKEYGIKLPQTKRAMLEGRLNKKVKNLGMDNYGQFLDYIFSDQGRKSDLLHVIDLITTNKTDFFREAAHFTFLTDTYLPHCIQEGKLNLSIWSAGCSSGEEPYTLMMVMEEFKRRNSQLNYNLLASDISVRVIQSAYRGIYSLEKIGDVPGNLKPRYFLRSKANPDIVRIRPEFRKKIIYRRINFMDEDYGLRRDSYDIIFCRNVLIYFDKQKQERVLKKFCGHLKRGGLLFLGHSESTMGMNLPLRQIKPTVYQLTDE